MDSPDTYLEHLYISIPIAYDNGKPVAYQDKSIAAILENQDVFEISVLKEWASDQLLGTRWDFKDPITQNDIEDLFHKFDTLGIKPTKCKYMGI